MDQHSHEARLILYESGPHASGHENLIAAGGNGFDLDDDLELDVRIGRQHGKRRRQAICFDFLGHIVGDREDANPGFDFFYAGLGFDYPRDPGSDPVDFRGHRVVGVEQYHELSGRGAGTINPKE
jgi:hypothetical protein